MKHKFTEKKMRINKYLAECGLGSRRACEELVFTERVKVNGVVMTDLSYQVDAEHDSVTVDGKLVKPQSRTVYYMLNKPKGVICAAKSDRGETTVVDLIRDKSVRLYPVGRLDKDTTGLLLLTNDGELAYHLTHPKFEKEKTYTALLNGRVSENDMALFMEGFVCDGEFLKAARAKIIRLRGNTSLISITLKQGKNRQIRRMCDYIGHRVSELTRVSEGTLKLGELAVGEYRALTAKEVALLRK